MRDRCADRVIDTERYPIYAPDSVTYRALVAKCRHELARDGASVLEGFLRGDRREEVVAELTPHLGKAYAKSKTHSAYLVSDDPTYPAEHPRNRKQTTSSATLAYDHIPRDTLINEIYRWEALRRFVADVLELPGVYPNADSLTPLNILIYGDQAQIGWHFDNAAFVLTLLLQSPERGGAFEFAPFIRAPDAENFDGVARVLDGRSDLVHELLQSEGALVLFLGSRTLHRVTPVSGTRPRLIAVLSYSPQEGFVSDEHTLRTFYGRAA